MLVSAIFRRKTLAPVMDVMSTSDIDLELTSSLTEDGIRSVAEEIFALFHGAEQAHVLIAGNTWDVGARPIISDDVLALHGHLSVDLITAFVDE
jgi:hypothetical protein